MGGLILIGGSPPPPQRRSCATVFVRVASQCRSRSGRHHSIPPEVMAETVAIWTAQMVTKFRELAAELREDAL